MSSEAISPVDGRYSEEARELAPYFSERALIRARFEVELSYLSLLVKLGVAPRTPVPELNPSFVRVKEIEKSVGHDVKAVEIFIREELNKRGAGRLSPFVHLGLTSEDTNSVAFSRLLSSALKKVLVPEYSGLALTLAALASREADTVMLARTHGRPAVPTTFGKEVGVFAYRLAERVFVLRNLRPMAKFSGAVGTYASFRLISSRIDWKKVLGNFVRGFGLDYAPYSTQVVPGERLSDILHLVININWLILGLARDLWQYQMLDYISFSRPGRVSSSTMPQKVNPVDLENAEGQAEISNSLLSMMAYRLQQTRMQRDLSDSVIRRTVGQALAHSLIATKRILASLSSMRVERAAMRADLERHSEVFGEAAQVLLRLRGDEKGYEKVKAEIEKGVFSLTPGQRKIVMQYLGYAPVLARQSSGDVRRLLSRKVLGSEDP